jgi:hypothetical protein
MHTCTHLQVGATTGRWRSFESGVLAADVIQVTGLHIECALAFLVEWCPTIIEQLQETKGTITAFLYP